MANRIGVVLTASDLAEAERVGQLRTAVNDKFADGAIDRNRTPLEIDIQGAIAELAFAKYYRLPWRNQVWTRAEWEQKRYDEPDVDLVEVKSANKARHRMIVPASDSHMVNRPFVFVLLHRLPVAELVGWCMGSFAIRPRFWDPRLPKPAWAVPAWRLGSMGNFACFLKRYRTERQERQVTSSLGHARPATSGSP